MQDPSRYTKTIFATEKNIKTHMKSRLFQDVTNMALEDGTVKEFEVKMDIRKILDDKPITIGLAILQYSKMLFLEFVYLLGDHLRPNSFTLCYGDTDSIAIGIIIQLVILIYK